MTWHCVTPALATTCTNLQYITGAPLLHVSKRTVFSSPCVPSVGKTQVCSHCAVCKALQIRPFCMLKLGGSSSKLKNEMALKRILSLHTQWSWIRNRVGLLGFFLFVPPCGVHFHCWGCRQCLAAPAAETLGSPRSWDSPCSSNTASQLPRSLRSHSLLCCSWSSPWCICCFCGPRPASKISK